MGDPPEGQSLLAGPLGTHQKRQNEVAVHLKSGPEMSRGLGALQLKVKSALDILVEHGVPTRFADLGMWCLVREGGEEGDTLVPSYERSTRRALKRLVDDGEVLTIAGNGSRSNPFHYMNVETFAVMATGKKMKGIAHAKQVFGEMFEEVTKVMKRGRRAK